LKEVAPRVGQLRAQAALHPDAHVDVALVRETIALLQSLLPVNPAADKQAQVDMASEHHARADRIGGGQPNDLEAVRYALFTGLRSAAKTKAQEAFLRVAKRIADIDLLDAWNVARPDRSVTLDGDVYGSLVRLAWRGGPRNGMTDKTFRAATLDASRADAAKALTSGELP